MKFSALVFAIATIFATASATSIMECLTTKTPNECEKHFQCLWDNGFKLYNHSVVFPFTLLICLFVIAAECKHVSELDRTDDDTGKLWFE